VRRRHLVGLIAGGIALVALIVVATIIAIGVIDRQNAIADYEAAAAEAADASSTVEVAVAEADAVLALAPDPLLVGDLAPVSEGRDAARDELAEAADLLALDTDILETSDVRDLTADLRDAAVGFQGEDTNLFGHLTAVQLTLHTAAPTVETTNFQAENQPHLAFRDAVVDLNSGFDDELIAERIAAYLDAAHALEASHAEEIAEKAGPLFDRRMVVEAFARSLACGVLLDFDWAVTVNGYGTGGSYGGTSYWQAEAGGYATISLSDSVATMWPGAGVQSLVAHEIGHAILSKCTDLFFESEFYVGEEESWATAWAIGLGYTADGSGESIYGRPADGLIQLSMQCR
jgi:hypothetical protein